MKQILRIRILRRVRKIERLFPGANLTVRWELDEHRGGYCQLGRGEEGNSSNRAELGAACLALEDSNLKTTGEETSNSPVRLSLLPLSSQKWIGEGKSPSMQGNPDADIMRDIVQLLRERIDQGLLTIFIKIKAHRGDPLNELADRWADKGRQSENDSLVPPNKQTHLLLD